MHGKERIIINRRNHPVAMILPISPQKDLAKGGLASVDWTLFEELQETLDRVYDSR